MGLQLIFVVETNKKCNSDWIYIKDTIEHFYIYERTQVKFSVVYLDGKGNYSSKKTGREINALISQYRATSKTNKSSVIFCFDCDDFDSQSDDKKFLEDAVAYCSDNEYQFVWFCKDVEQVYLGKKIENHQKKKEAANFKARKLVEAVEEKNLLVMKYQNHTSNILRILDGYPELSRK